MIEDLGEILVPGLLKPCHGLLLGNALPLADLALAQLALRLVSHHDFVA